VVIYINDILIYGISVREIDELIENLRKMTSPSTKKAQLKVILVLTSKKKATRSPSFKKV
jgi:hypothetical protein